MKRIYSEQEKEHRRNYQRERRERLKEKNICYVCGHEKVESGKNVCEKCRNKQRDPDKNRQAKIRQDRRESGLCVRCGKAAVDGKKRCNQCLESHRQYSAKTYRKILSSSKEYTTLSARRMKLKTIYKYGKCCTCCGESSIELLTIDHVNGGGNKHRKEIGNSIGSISFYYWLKKNNYPDEFRVLCQNCNWSMGVYGYCPHFGIEPRVNMEEILWPIQ